MNDRLYTTPLVGPYPFFSHHILAVPICIVTQSTSETKYPQKYQPYQDEDGLRRDFGNFKTAKCLILLFFLPSRTGNRSFVTVV